MSERSSSTVLNRTTTTEQKRGSLAERVWRGTDTMVRGQLDQAAQQMHRQGQRLAPERVIRLAHANQERRLQTADIDEWTTTELTANRIGLLVLEMPAAARAQRALDKKQTMHPRENEERKNAVIQFNHDFINTLVAMPSSMLATFPNAVRQYAADLYGQMDVDMLSRADIEKSTRGLSKEVAFARALQAEMPEDWELAQPTVDQDMGGIDSIVRAHGFQLNFDIKAAAAYLRSIEAEHDKGTLSLEEYQAAVAQGYAEVPRFNPKTRESYKVYLLDADRLGAINTFEYEDPTAVTEFVEQRLQERRDQTLQNITEYAINS